MAREGPCDGQQGTRCRGGGQHVQPARRRGTCPLAKRRATDLPTQRRSAEEAELVCRDGREGKEAFSVLELETGEF
jgi:hypothetical protein